MRGLPVSSIPSKFVQIEFVSSLRSQKKAFEIPDFKRKNMFLFCFAENGTSVSGARAMSNFFLYKILSIKKHNLFILI
jgi:hypothetical protein